MSSLAGEARKKSTKPPLVARGGEPLAVVGINQSMGIVPYGFIFAVPIAECDKP